MVLNLVLLANLSPFSWLVAVLAGLCFFLNFSAASLITCTGLILIASGAYFLSSWLAGVSQIFYSIRKPLNLLFLVIALNSAFSSELILMQLHSFAETQQQLSTALIISMAAKLLMTVSYCLLVLCAVTFVLEVSARVILGKGIMISDQIFITLRSFALISLLVFFSAEITDYMLVSFING